MLDSPRSTTRGDAAAPDAEALHRVVLDLLTADDAGEIAGVALTAAGSLLPVVTASLWVPVGDAFDCRGAVGEGDDRLTGLRVAAADVSAPLAGEEGLAILATGIAVNGRLTALLRVTKRADGNAGFGDAEQDLLRAIADAAGAAMAGVQRLSAARADAEERASDLAIVTEMSREITATLDVDRVLRSTVNLASKVVAFDRGAIALYERGACDIRAVAGADGVDPKNPALADLAVRAAWAAGSGERFYLSDRADPASDAERTFVQIFGQDLERDRAASGLYLPLRDEEGVIGILVFEAERVDFASPRKRELLDILANQATVAVRNAQLYRQVPMADTLGALMARKNAVLALPRRRRVIYASLALAVVAVLTLVRWPLRVDGSDPVLRPLVRADVRPTIAGIIDRVFVREGTTVARGAPIAHVRDDELRAERDAASAAATAADRAAAMAAARGDAAAERLERLRSGVLRRQLDVLDEQIAAATIRSPVAGVVLTPRPEERVDTHVGAGDLLVTVGRVDSLELELGVEQDEVTRVQVGDEVRLRVAALPQRTFAGRVTSIAALADRAGDRVRFPVRAVLPNEEALLRPGMAAYARVLTAPASVLGRLLRDPVRALRLLIWRIRS